MRRRLILLYTILAGGRHLITDVTICYHEITTQAQKRSYDKFYPSFPQVEFVLLFLFLMHSIFTAATGLVVMWQFRK